MAALGGTTISGQNTSSGKQETATYGDQRTCSFTGCTAPLSRYNPNDRCVSHPRSTVMIAPLPDNGGW